MVLTVTLVCDSGGNLLSARAHGHAGASVCGRDIVCAAATALLRTTLAVLVREFPDAITAESDGRGDLSFSVEPPLEGSFPALKYAALFLREGIESLAREYPESVLISVSTI
ncbi:MAG: ribosomal-processing cysteine protease Prp [Spirochaetales bacterium]|nr:ribosomal-processing cysteine protease Prp [Spirochaetales bacterium]